MNVLAAKSFGKFRESFLAEIHNEILHAKSEALGVSPQPVKGIHVQDSDVLEPEPMRKGGLVQINAVCTLFTSRIIISFCINCKNHVFRPPSKPLEPPTPRTSILGLDRLAQEKRAATTSNFSDRKRQKRSEDTPVFKGE